jgi:uncharacterized protein (DUF983 family)
MATDPERVASAALPRLGLSALLCPYCGSGRLRRLFTRPASDNRICLECWRRGRWAREVQRARRLAA